MIFKEPDSAWNALNPSGFKYGENLRARPWGNMTAGGMMRNAEESHLPKPGFCNNYAATAQEEDKAETWSHMLRVPGFLHDDKDVLKKMQYLKRLMKSRFPALDDEFWARVHKLHPIKDYTIKW